MKGIMEQSKSIQEELVKHRRQLHENAEIHTNLPKTRAYVKEQLISMGYEPIDCGEGGIVAVAGKKEGKVFLIRADMDALPIVEETDEPFKSKTCNMHACGHDMHTSMLLGAAKLLKENEGYLEGKVKLMFQPAEETLYGAKSMIEDGLLENPKVDAGMMIHVAVNDDCEIGDVLVSRPDVISASSDWLRIDIQGKGGHGARPSECIDPLTALSHIHIALQSIHARELSASDEAVLTIGQMHGGNTSNIIPDSAYMEGTIRCFNNDTRNFIKKRIEEMAVDTAKALRAEAKVSFPISCPSVINDKELFEEFFQYNGEILPERTLINMAGKVGYANAKTTGSEDFGFVSELIPTISCNVVVGNAKNGHLYKLHHPKVTFSEEPLYIGAAVYANTAIEWLKNNK